METVTREAVVAGLEESRVKKEHFGAEIDTDGEPFTVVTQCSGLTLEVPGDKSILQVLNDAGISVETSCQQGVCGSCLTHVLSGRPDHRDRVQTSDEKMLMTV